MAETFGFWINSSNSSQGCTVERVVVKKNLFKKLNLGGFFWCLFMHRSDLKHLKNLCWSFHEGKMVWKFWFPHCVVKNQNCRKLKCDLSKPIRRKIEIQWKKNQLNPTYLEYEKSRKYHPKIPFSRNHDEHTRKQKSNWGQLSDSAWFLKSPNKRFLRIFWFNTAWIFQ